MNHSSLPLGLEASPGGSGRAQCYCDRYVPDLQRFSSEVFPSRGPAPVRLLSEFDTNFAAFRPDNRAITLGERPGWVTSERAREGGSLRHAHSSAGGP